MRCCTGCVALFMLFVVVGLVFQAATWIWVSFWPMITGLTLSWVALRLMKHWQKGAT